jgi:hypothetical protein
MVQKKSDPINLKEKCESWDAYIFVLTIEVGGHTADVYCLVVHADPVAGRANLALLPTRYCRCKPYTRRFAGWCVAALYYSSLGKLVSG